MQPINLAIVLGSSSDLPKIEESELIKILDEVGVKYDLSIISAHRNPTELSSYCGDAIQAGAMVFIGIAGMAAALPGAIKSSFCFNRAVHRPVIGVPLPSPEFPGAEDALYSMVRMPPGMPVAVCGVGRSGLQNAALFACEIIALTNHNVRNGLIKYTAGHAKEAKFGVFHSKEKT